MVLQREIQTETVADEPVTTERQEYGMNLAGRIISFIGSIVVILLGLRLVLALLGANPANGFANFIYSVSHPFVAPFFGLFSYKDNLGVGHFEVSTLVAMIVYAIITGLLVRLATIGSRRAEA